MGIVLDESQLKAVKQLRRGSILCGAVGTGKSRTSLAYYYMLVCGGRLKINGVGEDTDLANPCDLYIITTAHKRDLGEWEDECVAFKIYKNRELSVSNVQLTVDSWNNIHKYTSVCGAMFIFDEQRLVGSGAWVKAFYAIAKKNHWILLSATPGDVWMDYIPVFVANGFYANKTEFQREHVIFNRYAKFPKVDRYVGERRLQNLKEMLLVDIDYVKQTEVNHEYIYCLYDKNKMAIADMLRDPETGLPFRSRAEYYYTMRKIVNSDTSRCAALAKLVKDHPRVIVFYNYDYELEILRQFAKDNNLTKAEWNGHMHAPVPKSSEWLYLVQYTAGAEGWNCTSTNVIVFWSQTYSYRSMVQACGRIDRRTTPYKSLYYYHLVSRAPIDRWIMNAVKRKKTFNEKRHWDRLGRMLSFGEESKSG